MGFDLLQPWWLLLLPLAALPLLRRRSDTLRFSAVAWLPPDPWGRAAGFLWRAFAIGAMTAAILGLAGPGKSGTQVLRTGKGAEAGGRVSCGRTSCGGVDCSHPWSHR